MRSLWLGVWCCGVLGGAASAQDTVRVRGVYDPTVRPGIVVLPGFGLDSIRGILARDLDYSDRFEVVELPRAVGSAATVSNGINYFLYKSLRASLAVELAGQSGNVTIKLHDLNSQAVRNQLAVSIDGSGVGEGRMAVHQLADSIVGWATGQKGMAATRILFLNRGDKRIYRIDSDGHGLAPVSPANILAMTPGWSPDGSRIVYTQLGVDGAIILQSLGTGTRVVLPAPNAGGQSITPAFSPDGRKVVFSRLTEQAANLYAVNAADLCCVERLTAGRFAENLSPVYSPDGRRIAFVSNRAGSAQVYSMAADGTDQELLAPFDFGTAGQSFAPDWSPDGSTIAFHREYSGNPQIVTLDLVSRQLRARTSQGRNEDPSFAPDNRHLVFVSDRTGRGQLWVLDLESGRLRP